MLFSHQQDDQEAQECPLSSDLEDFGCLGGDFVTVTTHMIHFGILKSLRISSKWWFGGFWLIFVGFSHCKPIFDTFLEFLGPL